MGKQKSAVLLPAAVLRMYDLGRNRRKESALWRAGACTVYNLVDRDHAKPGVASAAVGVQCFFSEDRTKFLWNLSVPLADHKTVYRTYGVSDRQSLLGLGNPVCLCIGGFLWRVGHSGAVDRQTGAAYGK